MFSENEKEWILEAINHLKRRKARPDFSRISLRLKRKHQLTITQTRQLLDSLVESGIVVKAVYKNNTSYRDVSKWKKGKLGGQILNSSSMLRRFVKAITATSEETNRKDTGVSATEIEEWLSHDNEDKCFLSGAALRDAIEYEVSNGFLTKVEINNDTFYSMNRSMDFDFNDNDLDHSDVATGDSTKDTQETDTKIKENRDKIKNDPRSFQLDADLYSTEEDFHSIKKAIKETEEVKGNGSKLQDIEKWLKVYISSKSSALYSYYNKDNRNILLKFLENLVKSGYITKNSSGNGALFSVGVSGDANSSCNSNLTLTSSPPKGVDDKRGTVDNQEQKKYNLPPLLEIPPRQSNKAAPISLRPPSKRKRILKNHGPDFEMELPTKSRARFSSAVAPKEYSFPTPLDSPVSEKSETTIEQSFKFDPKKKRGRPKKSQEIDQSTNGDDDVDAMEENKNDRLSEQSSVCQDDNDNEDLVSEPTLLPDVSSWTAQQVADYFMEQGYEEESKQMLENDLDGAALGLLRRCDIVGPPSGGMLKIKKLGVCLKLFRDIRDLLYQGNADNYMDPYEERSFYRT